MNFALYLTGAPASGKTTAAAALGARTGAELLSYGQLLTARLSDSVATQVELRQRSADVITPEMVRAVDDYVVERVRGARAGGPPVIVDSHAVTAESFGFRAVPYSASEFGSIGYSHIACLQPPFELTLERIEQHPEGRRKGGLREIKIHAQLQSALALAYAHSAGIPFAFIDSGTDLEHVVDALSSFVGS